MIVKSLLDNKTYFWVKVPRTATHSYEKIFFPTIDQTKIIHLHTPYSSLKESLCKNKPEVEYGFGVVRNPYLRFVSALKYIKSKHKNLNEMDDIDTLISICQFCGETTIVDKQKYLSSTDRNFVNFLENEEIFYDFAYSYLDKNCMLKSGYTWDTILQTESPGLVSTMFKTQTFFIYHPKVKIFKYENLEEFNTWIEHTLGYSTNTLGTLNSSKDTQLNIDVTTKKFKDLVRYLFHDDFKLFDYDT